MTSNQDLWWYSTEFPTISFLFIKKKTKRKKIKENLKLIHSKQQLLNNTIGIGEKKFEFARRIKIKNQDNPYFVAKNTSYGHLLLIEKNYQNYTIQIKEF